MLFAEACCGRRAFDLAFRQALLKAFPGQSMKPIPLNGSLFAIPNRISKLGVTPAMASHVGNRSTIEPALLGLEIEGHLAVIYSPYGMAGGWELAQNPYALGYEDAGAIALGENILMYGITQ